MFFIYTLFTESPSPDVALLMWAPNRLQSTDGNLLNQTLSNLIMTTPLVVYGYWLMKSLETT